MRRKLEAVAAPKKTASMFPKPGSFCSVKEKRRRPRGQPPAVLLPLLIIPYFPGSGYRGKTPIRIGRSVFNQNLILVPGVMHFDDMRFFQARAY
jgi:hypothetical protein